MFEIAFFFIPVKALYLKMSTGHVLTQDLRVLD